jgi:DUF4097 and DUF4098 domain-containing protein YvlB
MTYSCTYPTILTLLLALIPLFGPPAIAQESKEFSYTVGRKAIISITNNYGPITVKPSGNRQVIVTTVSHSDTVTFVNEQRGDRIELRAESNRQGTNLASYTVLAPGDAFVSLHSSDGSLAVQGMRGDVVLEAITAPVQVANVDDAHLHVRTLSGSIILKNISDSHLDIRSVSGNVELHDVSGSSAEVVSPSGRITYEGDPGSAGDYLLTSHSGDLDVSVPAQALVEIRSNSEAGKSDQVPSVGSNLSLDGRRNLLLKPGIGVSRFVLRSFRGKIRLKRP